MSLSVKKAIGSLAVCALACVLAPIVFAGETLKWEQVPEAVADRLSKP